MAGKTDIFTVTEDENEEVARVFSDPKEKHAMLTFLKGYNRLGFVRLNLWMGNGDVDRQIPYFLKINYGGRILLEASPDAIPGAGGELAPSCARKNEEEGRAAPAVALSLWPLILERSLTHIPAAIYEPNIDYGDDCTAAYYLLRHGPALTRAIGAVATKLEYWCQHQGQRHKPHWRQAQYGSFIVTVRKCSGKEATRGDRHVAPVWKRVGYQRFSLVQKLELYWST